MIEKNFVKQLEDKIEEEKAIIAKLTDNNSNLGVGGCFVLKIKIFLINYLCELAFIFNITKEFIFSKNKTLKSLYE